MKSGKTSPFFIGACALVAAGLILAFLAVGTPAHNRDVEFDRQRTSGLEQMKTLIRLRYDRSDRLPKTLPADFGSDVDPIAQFNDPQTGRRYEYDRIDEHRYRLCAKFSAPSDPGVRLRPREYEPDFPHPAGVFCKVYSLDD